jgi:hypothetical protein
MHPVLADTIHPFAGQVEAVSMGEAQVSPEGDSHRWSAQAVVEHLILDFQRSRVELRMRLKSGKSPDITGSVLQWMLKTQACLFGWMPNGVSTTLSLRPGRFSSQDGATLATRLLAAAEELDKALAECRISFGMRPCGYHPMYGPLRVEEWRVYHATHCRHHQRQFDEAIRSARRQQAGLEQPRSDARKTIPGARPND